MGQIFVSEPTCTHMVFEFIGAGKAIGQQHGLGDGAHRIMKRIKVIPPDIGPAIGLIQEGRPALK